MSKLENEMADAAIWTFEKYNEYWTKHQSLSVAGHQAMMAAIQAHSTIRQANAMVRIAKAQEELVYWASVHSNIVANGQGFPVGDYRNARGAVPYTDGMPLPEDVIRIGRGDIPDDPPIGATDTSIADGLSEQHRCFCGAEVADGRALRECAASHV